MKSLFSLFFWFGMYQPAKQFHTGKDRKQDQQRVQINDMVEDVHLV